LTYQLPELGLFVEKLFLKTLYIKKYNAEYSKVILQTFLDIFEDFTKTVRYICKYITRKWRTKKNDKFLENHLYECSTVDSRQVHSSKSLVGTYLALIKDVDCGYPIS
ncbi:MAG: hypothetical protein ACOVO2_17060, partial [Emticicia sp.]|uniref:hypothetical protein n=1 Tax=Emticicia sp. TaxID=1930953 RepID=UPI003BA55A4B